VTRLLTWGYRIRIRPAARLLACKSVPPAVKTPPPAWLPAGADQAIMTGRKNLAPASWPRKNPN